MSRLARNASRSLCHIREQGAQCSSSTKSDIEVKTSRKRGRIEGEVLSYVLLTGAGFSRNWGGWLANEAFEYLLGCSEVTPVIATELWNAKANGSGFEGTLEALRGLYATHKDVSHETELKTFESMLL